MGFTGCLRPANNNYCFYNQFPCQAYFLADFFQPDTLYAPKMLGEEMSNGFGYQPVPFNCEILTRYNTLSFQAQRKWLGLPYCPESLSVE